VRIETADTLWSVVALLAMFTIYPGRVLLAVDANSAALIQPGSIETFPLRLHLGIKSRYLRLVLFKLSKEPLSNKFFPISEIF
jgi:hypothetical protein